MKISIAWLAATLLALPASAQQHAEHGQRAPHRPMMMRMHADSSHGGTGMPLMMEMHVYSPAHLLDRRETLSLTDQQVQRFTQLQTEFQAAHERARQEAEEHVRQAQQAWVGGDANGVATHVRAGMEAMQQAHLAMVTASTAVRAALTAEQRARVQGWTDAMRMHGHHGGMDHRRHHGGT